MLASMALPVLLDEGALLDDPALLGRYAMKGVAMPQELFTLDPTWGG